MRNQLTLVACVVAVAATASAAYFYERWSDEIERSAALERRIAQLEQSSANVVSLSETPVAPRTASASGAAAAEAAPVAPRQPPFWNGPRGFADDPDSRAAMRARQKLRLMEAYPDLAAALHLRPDQADKLFDLLADRQAKLFDARRALRDKNLSPEELQKELQQTMAAQNAETNKQVAALVGDAKSREWQSYQDSSGVRTQVRDLKTLLESSGMPLRDDQTQILVDALMAQKNRNGDATQTAFNLGAVVGPGLGPGGGFGGGFAGDPAQRLSTLEQNLSRQEQQIQQTHDALASYLTPEQLKRYDEISAQQLQAQRLNVQRMRERMAAAAN